MPTQDVATVSAQTPTLGLSKVGFVIGNDSQWVRTINGLLNGDTPINAWITIKSSPAASDASGVQVMITTSTNINGPGVITITNGVGICTFNVSAGATISQLNAGPLYYYDIKVQCTPSTFTYTVEQGWIQFLPEVGDQPQAYNASIVYPQNPPPYLYGANPPPNGVYVVGTRYLVVPPVPGFPAEWVFANDFTWHVTSVVSN